MSSESEIVDVLSRVANIFLKAVDALETRMMVMEQRIDELERVLAGAPSTGRKEPTGVGSVIPSITQETWRSPPTTMPPPQQPQRVDAYGAPQQQWGSQRQEPYPPQPTPSYQTKPQPYPPQQQTQPASYSPPAQPQGSPYGPPSFTSQAPPPAGPPRPSSPLNLRQAVTGELKEVFAKMRARAEGR
nr:hypothetical protein [Candidatus Njordarchaeota archaeon]